jgi:peptide/nickel transport system substrate-binding protein
VQRIKGPVVTAAAVVVAGVLAATGTATASGSHRAVLTAATGGTLKVVQGSFPDSLDPQDGYTTQAQEADTAVYVPMLTYPAKAGLAGTKLVPGLASALPTVSADGLTYTMTMRSGITFSDGTPVVASDFTYGVERAIKLNWGGDSFFTSYIAGAADYQSGKATTISGIVTNDTTGAITITLTQPYGAFDNVLAFQAGAPVPPTTPMTVESSSPPLGDGPYKFGTIVPSVSYTLVKNPTFAASKLSTVPPGYVNEVTVTTDSNNTTEAQQVLANQADIFDPADNIPPSLLSQVKALPKSRYSTVALAEVNYFFLNVRTKPFNNLAVRQAVNMATDRTALARLAGGFAEPACFFLPPAIPGHPSGTCPSGNPNVSPSNQTVAKAKAMVAKAGMAGTSVTLWTETKDPRLQYMEYFQGVLNELGFKTTLKAISPSVYFATIGSATTNPQTGFADWSQDFPNPSDFYLLLDAASIQPTNNENFGNVDDPHIQSQLKTLDAVPATKLAGATKQWQALDTYVVRKAFLIPFAYETAPLLYSNRIASAVFNSVDYTVYASVKLK